MACVLRTNGQVIGRDYSTEMVFWLQLTMLKFRSVRAHITVRRCIKPQERPASNTLATASLISKITRPDIAQDAQ